jgi:signal transduction histidine kinase
MPISKRSGSVTGVDPQNVLLVEDDPGLSELVSSVLSLAGYRPIAIADHTQISASVDRWQPSCVILDGELRSTGESRTWDDAAAMRRAHPTVPVLMFSADSAALAEGRTGRSRRSRAAGFAGFVGKPFVVEDFLATVRDAVDGVAIAAPVESEESGVGNIILFPNIARPVVDPTEADLFDTVVHELRQPLTVIRGQLQLGRRQVGQDADRERGAIDLALAQVDRMSRLLIDLLDSARLASNGLSLQLVSFDLVAVIVAVIEDHEDGDARRISFEWPHGTVTVCCDPRRIAQILDNLMSNAIKYGPPGSPIEVTLTVNGPDVEVRVADRGTGVPEDERTRLFTPFYRASTSRNVPGTGLGLHISRRLAERQGGRLWLQASSGAGSVFTLALPVALDAQETDEAGAAMPATITQLPDLDGRTTA